MLPLAQDAHASDGSEETRGAAVGGSATCRRLVLPDVGPCLAVFANSRNRHGAQEACGRRGAHGAVARPIITWHAQSRSCAAARRLPPRLVAHARAPQCVEEVFGTSGGRLFPVEGSRPLHTAPEAPRLAHRSAVSFVVLSSHTAPVGSGVVAHSSRRTDPPKQWRTPPERRSFGRARWRRHVSSHCAELGHPPDQRADRPQTLQRALSAALWSPSQAAALESRWEVGAACRQHLIHKTSAASSETGFTCTCVDPRVCVYDCVYVPVAMLVQCVRQACAGVSSQVIVRGVLQQIRLCLTVHVRARRGPL